MKKILIEAGFVQKKDAIMWEFSKELKVITMLYTRILPELDIKSLSQIFIAINYENKQVDISIPTNKNTICTIFKSISINDVLGNPEPERRNIILNFIHYSILDACNELGWDKTPFEYTYQEILRRNFKGNFLMWGGKLFKRKDNIVGVDLDITKNEAVMSINLYNKEVEILKQIEIFRFRPDVHFITPMIGSAKWITDKEFAIFNKRKDIQFKVNIVSDKVEIVFDPNQNYSMDVLQDQLKIANAKTSKEELEKIFGRRI